MVQGLAFLSKKSWHTKNLANQEKVWMAEQQASAEASKTKELAKQIQQEMEEEELDRIAGKKSNRLDRGIDWMYQGGTGEAVKEDAAREAEDFLMGKQFVPEGASKQGDFSNSDNNGINAVLPSAAATITKSLTKEEAVAAPLATTGENAYQEGPSVNDRNELFTMRHEDPMFHVKTKEKEKTDQLAKKKALYERVSGQQGELSDRRIRPTEDENRRHRSRREKDSTKERKRERKRQSRREKGDKKLRHRSQSSSRSRSDSRERPSRRRDRDSRNKHSQSRRSRSRSRSEEHRRRPRRGESHYSSNDRHDSGGDRDHGAKHGDSHRRHQQHYRYNAQQQRHEKNCDDGDSHDRPYCHRDDERHERKSGYGHEISTTKAYDHARESGGGNLPREKDRRERKAGYGLIGDSPATNNNNNEKDLGPRRDLLDKKRREQETARRQAQRGSSRAVRKMTSEERAEAVQAMRVDASARDAALSKAASSKKSFVEDNGDQAPSGKASFLEDMTKKTHGIQENSQQLSLASRVAQNRHTNQKLNDSFL